MKATILPAGAPASCYPLTVGRDLAELPVANRPLRQAQAEEARAAGLDVVASTEASGVCLHIQGASWVSADDLSVLVDAGPGTVLVDSAGELLAFVAASAEPPVVPIRRLTAASAVRIVYPWHLLTLNAILIERLTVPDTQQGKVSPRATVEGVLVIGPRTQVLPGVYVEGKVLIGADCKVGPNCYLRGPLAIGDGCHIGQAVELKASILMNKVGIGHLSYAGDSVIGRGTNFGAGTITANFRHDGLNHRSMVGEQLVDTGRRKFGAIIGDGVHTGIHTSIYPGRKLWPHTSTRPGTVIQRDLLSSE